LSFTSDIYAEKPIKRWRKTMKAKKSTVAILLFLALISCASPALQLANAKAAKATFSGTLAWAPGSSTPIDFDAGQTTHRRNRITLFTIIETDNSLFDGTITRVVNVNRNNQKEFAQRWGTFEIVLDDVLIWEGTWTGRNDGNSQTENYVGRGVGAFDGMQLRFSLESPGLFVTGYILSTH
jgi:hypothetical protein